MKDLKKSLKELTEAFRHLQNARDAANSDAAFHTAFQSCLSFVAVLIADISDKIKSGHITKRGGK